MYSIERNRLVDEAGKPVAFQDTPNKNKPGSVQPRYLIMHYTAGVSLESSVSWLSNPVAEASAHFVIGRDGRIVQMVELNRRAWHAGESRWGKLTDMNSHSIGIELDNAGKLERRADGNYYLKGGKKKFAASDVVLATHKDETSEAGWHAYTSDQLDAAAEVGRALHAAFDFEDVLGHDDVSSPRKIDPGPAFPMTGFRSLVLGRS